ncbi:hypothetical protein T01_3631 [Trichinella spiralis]|uniref:Uncharacterized protein n=1 Tax=Trichinella spiralis TaxID=6334 RepID=A0A0V1B930_TRISP|nr:hypothetical protein T01_3631 [Trichinella spiralis]
MLPTKRELGKRGGRAGSNRTDDTDADMSPQIDIGVSSFGNGRGSIPVEARNEPAQESGSLHYKNSFYLNFVRYCINGQVQLVKFKL